MQPIVIHVDTGTSVTVWERTTDLNELTYDVPTLMGPGGTFNSLANEHYTFTSDGVSFIIQCFRDSFSTGTSSGNNIAAARLNGVPGYPGGLWATIIVSYVLGYGGVEDSRFNALGSVLSDHTWMGDQSSELVLGFTVENHPPVVRSFLVSGADEGQPVTYEVTADDADGQPLTYDYDFDGDGTWDLIAAGPSASHVFGDDFTGTARVRVSDGFATTEESASVLVQNVAPLVDVTLVGKDEVEEGCDGDDDREDEDDDREGAWQATRGGEGDDDDDADEDDEDDEDEDDDERECVSVTFRATAADPGSDDLTFAWDFGDGTTASVTHFNDGVGPDPFPSPGGSFPVTLTDETTHVYQSSGDFTVTLTVTDDDGGTTTVVTHVLVCIDDDCDDEDDDDEDDDDEDDDDEDGGCEETAAGAVRTIRKALDGSP